MDTEPAFHPTPLPSGGRRPVITSPHCRCGNLRPRHYPSHLGGGISPRSHYELALQNRSIMDLDFPVRLFVCSLLRRNRGVASNATPKPHQTSSTYLQPAEYELVSVATRGHGASGPSGANGLCTCNCHLRLRSFFTSFSREGWQADWKHGECSPSPPQETPANADFNMTEIQF